MAVFDGWENTPGPLAPGQRYYASYRTICLNSATNNDFRSALEAVDILTDNPNVSGPISTGVIGRGFYFTVRQQMGIAELAAKLNVAFQQASKDAWITCAEVELGDVQKYVAGAGINPGAAFSAGIGVTVVIFLALGFVVWKVAK